MQLRGRADDRRRAVGRRDPERERRFGDEAGDNVGGRASVQGGELEGGIDGDPAPAGLRRNQVREPWVRGRQRQACPGGGIGRRRGGWVGGPCTAGVPPAAGAPDAADAPDAAAEDGIGVMPGEGGTVGAGPAQAATSAAMARSEGRAPAPRRGGVLPGARVGMGRPVLTPTILVLPAAAATRSARDPGM